MFINPIYYVGMVTPCNVIHPLVCVGKYKVDDVLNYSKTDTEYAFFMLTDKIHYDEAVVLKQENCIVVNDYHLLDKPSIVNCAVEFRIKSTDLNKFVKIDKYNFNSNLIKKDVNQDLIDSILKKSKEVENKGEGCKLYLLGHNLPPKTIQIGSNYLNNWKIEFVRENDTKDDLLQKINDFHLYTHKSYLAAKNELEKLQSKDNTTSKDK